MPDKLFAINLLKKEGADERVIKHCIAVSKLAVEIACKISKKNNIDVDLNLVKIGGLLHDLGRSKTHGIAHGIAGAEILRNLIKDINLNLSPNDKIFIEKLARICERHIGAGIDKEEATILGIGEKDYLPETIEEKIIAHADNLIAQDKVAGIEQTIENFERKLGKNHKAVKRIVELNNYINSLLK
ncbi:conserved hypothetical protein [groundwater metagenome]|uniref:HD domain-containing protein n=1 Tax=groundwater metagenome TaxID=717931 RepID=A0A098E9L8_9ZZZZ